MKERVFSVVYMFVLTLCFTSAVSAVKIVNDERIGRNEEAKLQRVVLGALDITSSPGAESEETGELFRRRIRSSVIEGRTVYIGYDETDTTAIGYVFSAGGPGFWGGIEAMVAVDTAVSRIIGIEFYRQTETPGLGARITENWFTDQFRGLRIDRGEPFFHLVRPGTSTGPGELDAITGASRTGRAIENFLNREIAVFARFAAEKLKG